MVVLTPNRISKPHQRVQRGGHEDLPQYPETPSLCSEMSIRHHERFLSLRKELSSDLHLPSRHHCRCQVIRWQKLLLLIRIHTQDMTLDRNFLQKYQFLFGEFELIKVKKHPKQRCHLDPPAGGERYQILERRELCSRIPIFR